MLPDEERMSMMLKTWEATWTSPVEVFLCTLQCPYMHLSLRWLGGLPQFLLFLT